MGQAQRNQSRATLLISLLILGGVALWGYWALQDTVSEGLTMGTRAPEWSLPDLQGNVRHLGDFAGKPLVLRFSSRRCTVCPDDFGSLAALQEAYGDRVQFVAVELDVPADMVALAVQAAYEYPILVDERGTTGAAYHLDALPSLVFIDAAGRVNSRTYYRDLQSVDWDAHLAPLFAADPGIHPDLLAEWEAVTRQLQCLECSGRSVWESMSQSAWDLKEEALALLEAGLSRAEVLAYFEEEYGPAILLQPPRTGAGYLAYVMPFAFIGAGGLVLQWFLLRRRREGAGAAAPAEGYAANVDPALAATVEEKLKELL